MAESFQRISKGDFMSGGYLLFVPRTKLGEQPHVIAIDDVNDVVLSVEYETGTLRNETGWEKLDLHRIESVAIVFPQVNDEVHQRDKSVRVRGFLVSIEGETTAGVWVARCLGKVEVAEFPKGLIGWENFVAIEQPQSKEELRKGFLRHMFDNSMELSREPWAFTTPASVLEEMPSRWDQDARILNQELRGLFVGASRVPHNQVWSLYT